MQVFFGTHLENPLPRTGHVPTGQFDCDHADVIADAQSSQVRRFGHQLPGFLIH